MSPSEWLFHVCSVYINISGRGSVSHYSRCEVSSHQVSGNSGHHSLCNPVTAQKTRLLYVFKHCTLTRLSFFNLKIFCMFHFGPTHTHWGDPTSCFFQVLPAFLPNWPSEASSSSQGEDQELNYNLIDQSKLCQHSLTFTLTSDLFIQCVSLCLWWMHTFMVST